jgi:hypothetical protein
MPYNRKSLTIQTEDTEVIELRPEVDVQVQTEQVNESPAHPGGGGTFKEATVSVGVDKSTQV